MSSNIVCQVLVILCLHYALINAYMYGYPTPYGQPYPIAPYPYAPVNNFPYQQMYPSYGQIYPYPMNYPMQPSISPMPQEFPVQSQFNQHERIPVVPNVPGGNFHPSQGQVFPLFPPQSISTAYGNIPIEIIDVDPPSDPKPNNKEPSDEVVTTETTSLTAEESILTTSKSEEKKSIDIIPKPVQTSSIVQSGPTETKIVRTFDSKGVKVYVETSSLSPNQLGNEVTDNTESKDATTKKPFRFFF